MTRHVENLIIFHKKTTLTLTNATNLNVNVNDLIWYERQIFFIRNKIPGNHIAIEM